MTVTHFLGGLALLSLALTVWQIVVAARFPLHQRRVRRVDAAGLTILKPLKGCDAETAACLRSWLEQDYQGPVEILFGVRDHFGKGTDEVVHEISRILRHGMLRNSVGT